MFWRKFISVTFILLFTQVLFAKVRGPELVPITRDGVMTTRIAVDSWLTEYPSPVINVHADNPRGYTEVKGFKSLRKLDKPMYCRIKNGLYNPWSKTGNSVITYYTLLPLDMYQVLQATQLDNVNLHPGMLLTRVYYGSEGYCDASVMQDRKITKQINFYCDELEKPALKRLTKKDQFQEQWLYLKCTNGNKVFIRDEALLNTKGVTKGKFTSYGEVAAE